uniref:hsp70-binding protein 1-like n=1 Tax=Ictidomys tridecemlineatus TaxID=43179 RepID=UPI001A9DCDB8
GGGDGGGGVTLTSGPSAGLVREQEAGLLQFLRLDGFSVLMRAMQQQVQKLKVKSAFLLQNLLVGHPEHKGTLCSMGMVQQLVALVRTEHSPFHEHVLGALCSLVTDFPQGVRECREPELGLEELLRHRCQLLQQHEEYQVRGVGSIRCQLGSLPPPPFCGGYHGRPVSLQGSEEEGWCVKGFH